VHSCCLHPDQWQQLLLTPLELKPPSWLLAMGNRQQLRRWLTISHFSNMITPLDSGIPKLGPEVKSQALLIC
jgi:hypothetical protein